MCSDLIKGSAIAKNEVNRALDEAIVKEVNTLVVIKSVLRAIKTTVVKCSLCPRDAKCHCLASYRSNHMGSCVLHSLINVKLNHYF